MSAFKVVQDLGDFTVTNATQTTFDSHIIRTGVLRIGIGSIRDGCRVGVANTNTIGFASAHIGINDDTMEMRYSHPAQAVVTGITTGLNTILTLSEYDTKLRVNDHVKILGEASQAVTTGVTTNFVGYSSMTYAKVVDIFGPTITGSNGIPHFVQIQVDYNTSEYTLPFVGIATVYKMGAITIKPDSAAGTKVFIEEIQGS